MTTNVLDRKRNTSRPHTAEAQGEFFAGLTGGNAAASATNAEDTLKSTQIAYFSDVVSWGPIYGLVDGHKSIKINGVPLQNADNSYNFSGYDLIEKLGTESQTPARKKAGVAGETGVNTLVTTVTPIIANLDGDFDGFRARVRINSLYSTNGSNNRVVKELQFKIEWSPEGAGTWSHITGSPFTLKGKNAAPYYADYDFSPPSDGPWDIRITRLTADDTAGESSPLYFDAIIGLLNQSFSYPWTAYYDWKVQVEEFGSNLENRTYEVYGRVCRVPTNYDSWDHSYTGFWDGTWKEDWTDDPAWVFLDLMNSLYGLDMADDEIAVATLYSISQYNNQPVPDGNGGTEPRYRINVCINTREEAVALLNKITAVFRGAMFWSQGQIDFMQDSPKSVAYIVGPANTENGLFDYRSTASKNRANQIIVAFNDPDNDGEIDYEIVEDNQDIMARGVRSIEVQGWGAASRGQARRIGEWLLYTLTQDTELVTYVAGMDHDDIKPGYLVAIADPVKSSAFMQQGRVNNIGGAGNRTITLDRPLQTFASGHDYGIALVNRDTKVVTYYDIGEPEEADEIVTLTTDLVGNAAKHSMWIIYDKDVGQRLYTVIGVDERGGRRVVSGLLYNSTKFDYIERDKPLGEVPSNPFTTGPLHPPTEIHATCTNVPRPGAQSRIDVQVSWTAPIDDNRVAGYILEFAEDAALPVWNEIYRGRGTSFTAKDVDPTSDVAFRVRSYSHDGQQKSVWVVANDIELISRVSIPDAPILVQAIQEDIGGSLRIVWDYVDGAKPEDFLQVEVFRNTSDVFATADMVGTSTGTDWLDTNLVSGTTYYYWVRTRVNSSDPTYAVSLPSPSVNNLPLEMPLYEGPGIISEDMIADAAISANKLMDNAVTELKIAALAVATAKIQVAAVTNTIIANNAVQEANIAAVAVTAAKIANLAVETGKLADDAVTALKLANNAVDTAAIQVAAVTNTIIANNAVQTANIASLAVTAAQVANATLTGTQIAAATIAAGNIVSGTITTTQIAAGTITATNIAAGTITATQIASGAITTVKIAAGAVTANEIAAATITGDKLVANTITVSRLVVSDFSNMIPDSNLTDINAWVDVHGLASYSLVANIAPNATTVTDRMIRSDDTFSGGTNNQFRGQFNSANIKVEPNADYYFACKMRTLSSAEGRLEMWVSWRDKDNVQISTANVGQKLAPSTTSTQHEAILTAPSTANWAMPFFRRGASATGTGAGWIAAWDVIMRKAASGNLMVDGTITAAKILTGTITALQIAAGTITATQITAGTITATEIAAGTITATQLATNSVTAVKIAASTITGDKIAAATITADKLVASSITTRELVIVDFSNVIPDAGFSDIALWTLSDVETGMSVAFVAGVAGTGAANGKRVRFTGAATDSDSDSILADVTGAIFPIEPGTEYALGAYYTGHGSATGKLRVYIRWYDSVLTNISSSLIFDPAVNLARALNTTIVTSPTDAAFAKVLIRRQPVSAGGSVPNTNIYIDSLYMRRAANANLIVDGAVTAVKIGAEAIEAGKIHAGAIDVSTLMVDNVVITAKILANNVTVAAADVLASDFAVTAGSSNTTWDTIAEVTVTPNGGSTLVIAGLMAGTSDPTAGSAFGGVEGRILRDGSQVVIVSGYYDDFNGSSSLNASFPMMYRDTASQTTSHTYTLQCRWDGNGGGIRLSAWKGSGIMALNAKR